MMQRTCAQVAEGKKSKETKKVQNREEMIAPQQSHNVHSLNGDVSDHNMHEAQTLADAMCDFNDTFKMEENFTNLWQQSMDTKEESEPEFSEEIKEIVEKEQCEQHAQQHVPEKGLKTSGKKGKMQC